MAKKRVFLDECCGDAPSSGCRVDDGGILPSANTEVGSNINVRFQLQAAIKVVIGPFATGKLVPWTSASQAVGD